jgi:hypothetical protein
MKVFISWSGKRSRLVAELLHNWIQCVIQAVEPWVSSHDIDRGAVWFSQISNELGASTQGIICLTRDNKDKPWILFEAGALAKGLTSSRVYTLLIDLKPEDIRDPLAQFNHTLPTKDDLYKLILGINRGLDTKPISDNILRQVFEANWQAFEERFNIIITETEAGAAPEVVRESSDILSEILDTVRSLDRRVRTVENNAQSSLFKTERLADKIKKGTAIVEYNSPTAIADLITSAIPLASFLLDEGMSDDDIINRIVQTTPIGGGHALQILSKAKAIRAGL